MPKQVFCVFLDESGNTGEVILDKANVDNFNNQPYFVLGGFGAPISALNEIQEKVYSLKKEYKIPFKELKGTKLWPRYRSFVYELLRYLHSHEFPIFVEIMDKKYFICMNISEIILIRSGFTDVTNANEVSKRFEVETRSYINDLADKLYLNLSKETLIWFSKASRSPDKEYVETFLAYLHNDSNRLPKNYCELIEKAIEDYFSEVTNYFFNPIFYETPPWEEYVPFPDPNEKSRKRISLLPHTTAVSNIYLRVNRYSREFGFSEIVIKHDEQKQWEGILKNMLDFLKSQSSSIFRNLNKYLPPTFAQILDFEFDKEYQLIFEDSKNIYIQEADVISGSLYKI